MTHTLTISDLDDFEAEHIAEILASYRARIIEDKLEALANKDMPRYEWLEDHLNWHDKVIQKIKWTKKPVDTP